MWDLSSLHYTIKYLNTNKNIILSILLIDFKKDILTKFIINI